MAITLIGRSTDVVATYTANTSTATVAKCTTIDNRTATVFEWSRKVRRSLAAAQDWNTSRTTRSARRADRRLNMPLGSGGGLGSACQPHEWHHSTNRGSLVDCPPH